MGSCLSNGIPFVACAHKFVHTDTLLSYYCGYAPRGHCWTRPKISFTWGGNHVKGRQQKLLTPSVLPNIYKNKVYRPVKMNITLLCNLVYNQMLVVLQHFHILYRLYPIGWFTKLKIGRQFSWNHFAGNVTTVLNAKLRYVKTHQIALSCKNKRSTAGWSCSLTKADLSVQEKLHVDHSLEIHKMLIT